MHSHHAVVESKICGDRRQSPELEDCDYGNSKLPGNTKLVGNLLL